jgi:hypothetical protein
MIVQVTDGLFRGSARLEMDVGGSAPTGALTSAAGRPYPFTGWTELAAAIEKWRSDTRRDLEASQGTGAMPERANT